MAPRWLGFPVVIPARWLVTLLALAGCAALPLWLAALLYRRRQQADEETECLTGRRFLSCCCE